MTQTVRQQVIFREILSNFSPVSHRKWEISLKRINVHILEMEDVLFHHNSAVMMPENPEGGSSSQGGGSTAGAAKVTGVKALALAFKQFEFNPKQKAILAGHTDTSGDAGYNFELSELRAKNVLYLLIGEQVEWAKICQKKQKIEDHQQILTWVFKKRKWLCNPGEINNKWSSSVEQALTNFVTFYNTEYADKKGKPRLDEGVVKKVRSDGEHRWPVELWEAVYNLYNDELAAVLQDSPEQLDKRRTDTLRFVSDTQPFVACGESFPIKDGEKSNYRSQANRRVEILFFDADEAPEMTCPKQRASVHKEKECPLYHGLHFLPLYIDPSDLNAVMYHLSFKFHDRIANKLRDVPDGLQIKAYQNGNEEIEAETLYQKHGDAGVYHVKLRFKTPLNDPNRKTLHFEFKTTNQWVFTDSDAAEPVLKTEDPATVRGLELAKRLKYYDLPVHWSSQNYWTRYDGNLDSGARFEKVLKTDKKLRPFGGNVTAPDKPLVFSLDDIVLLDTVGGTQDIKDCNHATPPVEKDLSDRSRVKIFVVDATTGQLKLFLSGAEAKTARVPFPENLVVPKKAEDMRQARILFFRDGFYTIGNKRTVSEANWVAKGFVLGARAAVRTDPDYHIELPMAYNHTEFGSTGDYDLHYFHHLQLEGTHPVSFTISYVSISFMSDCRTQPPNPPAPAAPINPKPGKTDVAKFVDDYIYNAMRHWNKKQYYLEEDPASATSTIIRPLYFFDERELFEVADPQPDNINFDKRPTEDPASNFKKLFDHAKITTARENALGGKSKFLALVCRNENGDWGPAYQWAVRTEGFLYSLFKLNLSSGEDHAGVFPEVPITEHGDSFGAHTFAHELGHATGQPDEYVKTNWQPDPAQGYATPDFEQFFLPYSMSANAPSMMYKNGAPRLHHLWYPMHRLIKGFTSAPLKNMLPDKSFVARLHRGTWDITYTRKIGPVGASSIDDNQETPLAEDGQFAVAASPQKRLSLKLFDVGKDESSIKYFHANQDAAPSPIQYQGVLAVRALLSCDFSHGTWTGQDKALRVYQIEQAWLSYGGHYRLKGGAGAVKNIYIHFLPGFLASDSGNSSLGDANFTLDFRHANAPASGTRIPNSSGTVTVYDDVTAAELVRYFLNIVNIPAPATDLRYLKTWADGKLTDTYTLESF